MKTLWMAIVTIASSAACVTLIMFVDASDRAAAVVFVLVPAAAVFLAWAMPRKRPGITITDLKAPEETLRSIAGLTIDLETFEGVLIVVPFQGSAGLTVMRGECSSSELGAAVATMVREIGAHRDSLTAKFSAAEEFEELARFSRAYVARLAAPQSDSVERAWVPGGDRCR